MADQFTRIIDRWGGKLEKALATRGKRIAITLHDRIVLRTPVDTGRARASWQLTAGTTPDLTVQPESFSGGAGAATVANRGKQKVKDAPYYIISNNLPYIERLEQGWSKQAPNGMVLLALADVKTMIELNMI